MSGLSPLCAPKRTFANASDFIGSRPYNPDTPGDEKICWRNHPGVDFSLSHSSFTQEPLGD
jgi:hypothetical protein